MKSSNADPIIVLICTCFLYYYIILGHGLWYDYAVFYTIRQKVLFIDEGIVYAGLFAVVFSLIYVFKEQLYPFNRHFVKRAYFQFKDQVRAKIEEGKRLHKEYMNRKK